MGEQSMADKQMHDSTPHLNEPVIDIVEVKMEWLNDTIGKEFEKDRIVRAKLKEIKKYNRLSIKTKLKRLCDKYKGDVWYFAKNIIEQGGHPELGFEHHYETHLTDEAYDALKKGRARRDKLQQKQRKTNGR